LHVPSSIDRNKNDKTISPSIPPAFSANTFGSEHSISELSVSLATVHRNRINYKTDKIHEVLNKVIRQNYFFILYSSNKKKLR